MKNAINVQKNCITSKMIVNEYSFIGPNKTSIRLINVKLEHSVYRDSTVRHFTR